MLQGYERGMTATVVGADETARDLGFNPVSSLKGLYDIQAETCFHPAYREWARLMQSGMEGRRAYGEAV
jgi:hypothetical protein